jgi:hypothetical protein
MTTLNIQRMSVRSLLSNILFCKKITQVVDWIFFWCLKAYMVNCYILYCTDKEWMGPKPMIHVKFLRLLAESLVNGVQNPIDRFCPGQ